MHCVKKKHRNLNVIRSMVRLNFYSNKNSSKDGGNYKGNQNTTLDYQGNKVRKGNQPCQIM